jgi:hypothetical protein
VKGLFWDEDVPHILAIPVHVDRVDTMAWHFDKKGCFSVKSTYHILEDAAALQCTRQSGVPSSACDNRRKDCWKEIWRLHGPPKIKQFVWRVAHNSLALRMNIRHKGIKLDTNCPICVLTMMKMGRTAS